MSLGWDINPGSPLVLCMLLCSAVLTTVIWGVWKLNCTRSYNLNLVTQWRWAVSFTLLPHIAARKGPLLLFEYDYQWVPTHSGWWWKEKSQCSSQELNSGHSAHNQFLYLLSCHSSCRHTWPFAHKPCRMWVCLDYYCISPSALQVASFPTLWSIPHPGVQRGWFCGVGSVWNRSPQHACKSGCVSVISVSSFFCNILFTLAFMVSLFFILHMSSAPDYLG